MLAQTEKIIEKQHDCSLNDANAQALSKLNATLGNLSDAIYTKAPAPGLSPIGGHVRHIIEFYQEFFKAEKNNFTPGLSYDNRQRNMLYETQRTAAISEIENLMGKCKTAITGNQPIALSMTTQCNNPDMEDMITTPARELFHLLDHATHHMALIKMTAEWLGCECDQNFGMANATMVHNSTCAQ